MSTSSSFFINYLRDEDLRVICQNHSESDYAECVEPCTDIDCLLECGRILTECSM